MSYFTNDERFIIKNEINSFYKSGVIEERIYNYESINNFNNFSTIMACLLLFIWLPIGRYSPLFPRDSETLKPLFLFLNLEGSAFCKCNG